MTKFLRNPAEISKALRELQTGERLDLAVAFIGEHWKDLLSDYTGRLRVICWLSSTNTNPYAVEQLKKRRSTEIKQRDSLHCKVYLSPGKGAVVGSANLSKPALNDILDEDGISGQDEAAVYVTAAPVIGNVEQWFRKLWKHSDTRKIRPVDLKAAKEAHDKAKAAQTKALQNGKVRNNGSMPAIPKSFDPEILRYAKRVCRLDLREDLGEACDFVSSIEPSKLTTDKRKALVDYIASWTGHPGVYGRFLSEPIARSRAGLELLFDDWIDLQSRLERIQQRGYLPGFKMPR